MRLLKATLITPILLWTFVWSVPLAQATLGEKEDSVDKLAKTLTAERHASTTQERFTVHEIANGGLTVREFAGKDGVIFGVAWQGITQPDLEPILGSFYGDFSQGMQQASRQKGRARHGEVHGSKITVLKSGHMRAVRGKAFVSSLLPEGVTADDIQ